MSIINNFLEIIFRFQSRMFKKMNTVFGLKDDDKYDNEDDKFF